MNLTRPPSLVPEALQPASHLLAMPRAREPRAFVTLSWTELRQLKLPAMLLTAVLQHVVLMPAVPLPAVPRAREPRVFVTPS